MASRLVEINKPKLYYLRHLFAQQNKVKNVACSMIDNFIRIKNKDPNKGVKLYCLNGDISDGTFLMTDRFMAYADTLNENHGNLFRMLQLLDYSKGYLFLETRTGLRSTIINAIQKMKAEIENIETAQLYYLPKEKALKLDVQPPDGIILKPVILESDLEKVCSLWTYNNRASLQFFERMAKYKENIGAFKEDGTLVSWAFRYSNGFICGLQTDKNYRKFGYGSLVSMSISKKIAECGQDVFASIVEGNRNSENVTNNIGFIRIGEVDFIKSKFDWNNAIEPLDNIK